MSLLLSWCSAKSCRNSVHEYRPHRVAYILGVVLDLSGPEAAAALGIDAAALRKRLERAGSAVFEVARSYCGLASDDVACSCNRRVPAAIRLGRERPDAPAFAEHAASFDQLRATVRSVEQMRVALALQHSTQPRGPAVDAVRQIMTALYAANPRAEVSRRCSYAK